MTLAALALLLTGTLACVGSAWQAALQEDSAAAYHRFLREYPDSKYTPEAHERIDFVNLRREPTLANFRAFQEKHPSSDLVTSLRDELETVSFNEARALGTPKAYEALVENFPNGAHAARARGNAAYLRDLAPNAAVLGAAEFREFALQHPASDFAAEAKRSADAVMARASVPSLKSVGLVLQLAPGTPEAKRVTAEFYTQAKESYAHAPAKLVFLQSAVQATSRGLDALITVRHSEQEVTTSVSDGVIGKPGVQVRTEVVLSVAGEVVWSRPFEMRVVAREHVAGTSVLFSSDAPRFWSDFFLPVATWSSRAAVRAPVALDARAAAVDTQGDRAVVLTESGDFQILQIADPENPVRLGSYDRKSKLEHFDGVRLVGSRVAIFGEDGIELVGFDGGKPAPLVSWSRGQVGRIFALEVVGDQLLLGSNKGLLKAPADLGAAPTRLLRRSIVAMARERDIVLLADKDMVLISTVGLLSQKRLLGQLRVGKDFAAHQIRVFGSAAFVIGKGGVLVLDISKPRVPRMVARLLPKRVGAVEDVARVGKSFYLAGDRGIQVLGPRLDRVVDTVDTLPARRVATLGRHVVAVGGEQVQVVDGLPFTATGGVAKARPAARAN